VEHINTSHTPIRFQASENLLDLGVIKAHRLPVGMYAKAAVEDIGAKSFAAIWTRERVYIDESYSRPLLVMIGGRGNKISTKMQRHYSDEENKRWNRLQGELAWIYLDSYFVLTKWDRVWSAIKENMRLRVAVVSHSLCLNILSNLPLIFRNCKDKPMRHQFYNKQGDFIKKQI
jgi:hypothetical protein